MLSFLAMKALFICNQNKNRSKTAEEYFKKRFTTRSAGLYNEEPVEEKDFSWADIVFVMEEDQRQELAERFPNQYLQKRILSLEIPDSYQYQQPELIQLLRKRMQEYEQLF